MKRVACFVFLMCSVVAGAQEVQVTPGKNTVTLSVSALKPYDLLSGEKKTAVLSVECSAKGKKAGHIVTFAPGGAVSEDSPEGQQVNFTMTIGGTKQSTSWVAFGDTVTFAYFGKHEPERLQFIQSLLNSGVVSIEFKPFLTGESVTSVFDLSKLRAEMDKQPECALK